MALSPGQVYGLARDAGLGVPEAVTATAIAFAESGGNASAVGDVSLENATWGPSVGLWQIRSLKADRGTGRTRDETRLADPTFNARSMATISNGGKSFKPWSTFTSGKFKAYMPAAASAASGAISFGPLGSANLGDAAAAAASAASKLNPFAGWQDDVASIALKLTAAGAGIALFVMGARRAVTS